MQGSATQHVQVATRRAPSIALLADHLDAVLRHGEALRAIELPSSISAFEGPSVGTMLRRSRQIEAVVGEAHALELAISLRLTQAQVTARQAKQDAGPLGSSLLRLIATAAEQVGRTEQATSASASTFLASRGVARDATLIGEDYRIAGSMRLGDVMDAAAAALDLLDTLAPPV